jgi:uncharacterized protein YuzE
MMKTSYDPAADAFYARFAPDDIQIAETKEVAPGVMIDLDASGNMVGIEVLSVIVRGNGAYGAQPVRNAAE